MTEATTNRKPPTERELAIERFRANAGPIWQQPDVEKPPKKAAQAALKFHCPVIDGDLTGRQCAERHINETSRVKSKVGGIGHTYRGRCGECPSGKARAALLQIGSADIDARREERQRFNHRRSVELDRQRDAEREKKQEKAKPRQSANRVVKPKKTRKPRPPAPKKGRPPSKTAGMDLSLPINVLAAATGLSKTTIRRHKLAAGFPVERVPKPDPVKPAKKKPEPASRRRLLNASADDIVNGSWFTLGDFEAVLPAGAQDAATLLRRWRKRGELDREGQSVHRRYRLHPGQCRAELKQQLAGEPPGCMLIRASTYAAACGRSAQWAGRRIRALVEAGDAYVIGSGASAAAVITSAKAKAEAQEQIPPPQSSESRILPRRFHLMPWIPIDELIESGAVARTGKPGRGTSWLYWVVDGEAVDRRIETCRPKGQ